MAKPVHSSSSSYYGPAAAPAAPAAVAGGQDSAPAAKPKRIFSREVNRIPGLMNMCVLPYFNLCYQDMRSVISAFNMKVNRGDLLRALKIQLESSESRVTYQDLQRYERLSGKPLTSDKITQLWISNTDLNDQGLKAIVERFPNLEKIYIEECPNITGAGLKFLPNNLKHLRLYSSTMHDEDLAGLPKNLQELSLKGAQFTDACIPYLPEYLRELSLWGNSFTDACVANLPKRLVKLLLHSSLITADAIPNLPKDLKELTFYCPKLFNDENLPLGLERLQLNGCRLNGSCIRKLVSDRPYLAYLFCNWIEFHKEALDKIRA